MVQIWDFSRSVSVHFGSPNQSVLKLILKVPDLSHLWQIRLNLDAKFDIPGTVLMGLTHRVFIYLLIMEKNHWLISLAFLLDLNISSLGSYLESTCRA